MSEKNKSTEELMGAAKTMNDMLASGDQKFRVSFALHGELFVKVPHTNSVPKVKNMAEMVTAITGVKVNVNS